MPTTYTYILHILYLIYTPKFKNMSIISLSQRTLKKKNAKRTKQESYKAFNIKL